MGGAYVSELLWQWIVLSTPTFPVMKNIYWNWILLINTLGKLLVNISLFFTSWTAVFGVFKPERTDKNSHVSSHCHFLNVSTWLFSHGKHYILFILLLALCWVRNEYFIFACLFISHCVQQLMGDNNITYRINNIMLWSLI